MRRKCWLFSGFLLLAIITPLYSQWMKAYGRDNGNFRPGVIQATPEGGFIACGSLSGGRQDSGEYYRWVLKLSSKGNVEWFRSYSHSFFWITPTREGGYIACGWYGIFKLDAEGFIEWKTEIKNNIFENIQQTQDGGYITIALRDGGLNWDKTGHRIFKFSSEGKVEWKRMFAIADNGQNLAIREAPDGNFVAMGNTDFRKDGRDFWFMKISPKGKSIWQKVYGGDEVRRAVDFDVAPDGSYFVLGYAEPDHWADPYFQTIWITRILPDGEVAWHKVVNGANPYPYAICTSRDGGCLFVGYISTKSYPGLIVKLNGAGDLEWERYFGAPPEWPDYSDERGYGVCQAADGDFMILGLSDFLGFTPNPEYTTHNYLVGLKLAENGSYPDCKYIDPTSKITLQDTEFPLKPLTFAFSLPKVNAIDREMEVFDLKLKVVDELCAWIPENGTEDIRKNKAGVIRR